MQLSSPRYVPHVQPISCFTVRSFFYEVCICYAWCFDICSTFFTEYMDVNIKWPTTVHSAIIYDIKTNKCMHVCMKVHFKHSIPLTCFFHSCDHLQGSVLQWIDTFICILQKFLNLCEDVQYYFLKIIYGL